MLGRICLLAAGVGTVLWLAIMVTVAAEGDRLAAPYPSVGAVAICTLWVIGTVTTHSERHSERLVLRAFREGWHAKSNDDATDGRPLSRIR